MKTGKADLHIHSNHSDGSLPPKEIVYIAATRDLQMISITDHDTVSAVKLARQYGDRFGVEVISGVELSAQQDEHDIHFLGYLFDVEHPKIQEYLDFLIDERRRRARQIVINLQKMGIRITMDDVQKHAANGYIGRPHICQAMLENGEAKSIYEVFNEYIGDKAPAFVPKSQLTPKETLELISAAGGVSILAHPSKDIIEKYFDEWRDQGLNGIEILHPRYSTEDAAYLKNVADRNNLLVSGGSDCHGQNRADRIGRFYVSSFVVNEMKAYLEKSAV